MPASVPRALSAIALFCLIGLGRTAQAFIDNGIAADPAQFPYVVHLKSAVSDCTGTIVGPNTVLTAAHCVTGLDPKNPKMSITLPDGSSAAAAEFLAYPGSDSGRIGTLLSGPSASADAMEFLRLVKSELAVLKTAPGVRFAKWAEVDPAPAAAGQQVTLAGYGYNDNRDHSGNGPLRSGTNQIQWESHGVLFLSGRYYNVTDREGKDKPDGEQASCDHGDSGGPLFADRRLIGVAVAAEESGENGMAYERINRALGDVTGHLLARTDDPHWFFYASIGDKETVEFLSKTAAAQGYQIAWAQGGAAPAPRDAPRAAPALNASPAFNELLNNGGFAR